MGSIYGEEGGGHLDRIGIFGRKSGALLGLGCGGESAGWDWGLAIGVLVGVGGLWQGVLAGIRVLQFGVLAGVRVIRGQVLAGIGVYGRKGLFVAAASFLQSS